MNEVELLVSNLKSGDQEAFAILYKKFEKPLCSHLYKMLGKKEKVEEVFQDTMLKMIRKIDFYSPRNDLKNSFKAWLFRIATNLAIDEIRKQKKLKQLTIEDLPVTNSTAEEEDTKQRISSLIMKLPAKQRTFLNLKVNEDLSHLEIATICGCNMNTVKQGLFRARKNLKDLLIKEGIIL